MDYISEKAKIGPGVKIGRFTSIEDDAFINLERRQYA